MKKIFTLIIILCLSISLFAQENKGLDNRFYFRFGYSKPANNYAGWSNSPFLDDLSRTGGVFELGSIFIFNNLDLGDGLRLGVNVDYIELVYHQFIYDDNLEEIVLHTGQLSSKVGPSLSFNPVSRLVFDVFFKAKIPWVSGAYISAPDDPDLDEESYLGSVGFGFSTGFNIRFSVLILGFDYSNSSLKLENRDDSEIYLGNFFDFSDVGDKTNTGYFNFTVGLNF